MSTVPREFCEFMLALIGGGYLRAPGEIDRLLASRCWERPEPVEATAREP